MFKPFLLKLGSCVHGEVLRAHIYEQKRLLPMFIAAWEGSFEKDTILKAFEATGLSPFLGAGVLATSNATVKVLQHGDDFNNLLGEMTRSVQAEVASFIGGESGTMEMVWWQGSTEHGRRARVSKKDGSWEYVWWEVVRVDIV
jgi:hypothetical protein